MWNITVFALGGSSWAAPLIEKMFLWWNELISTPHSDLYMIFPAGWHFLVFLWTETAALYISSAVKQCYDYLYLRQFPIITVMKQTYSATLVLKTCATYMFLHILSPLFSAPCPSFLFSRSMMLRLLDFIILLKLSLYRISPFYLMHLFPIFPPVAPGAFLHTVTSRPHWWQNNMSHLSEEHIQSHSITRKIKNIFYTKPTSETWVPPRQYPASSKSSNFI